MKKHILTALCLGAALVANAQTDATINSLTETYTLKPDGAIDYDYSKSITYNTHFGFFSLFGETFVVYNPEFQKLKINESYTVQKDGTRIDSPANAFNEVLPSAAANSADYNGLREMVITHTGLEKGATTRLSYSLSGTPQGCPTLDIDRVIPIPGADIKEYKIVVNVPEGKRLNWSLEGSSVKPVIKGNTYTWTFRNVPAASGDAFSPRNHTGMPRLSVTSASTLEEELRPLTVETMDICRVPGDILKGKTTTSEKIAAIQNFMVNSIATGYVTPDLTGYNLRQCNQVIQTAYGTEAEKAAAMAKLLRGEGIDAQTVVVFPAEIGAKNIRNISKYLVKADGKFYAVDRVGEYNAGLRADRDAIYDLGGNAVSVAPAHVVLNCTASMTLSADSVAMSHSDCKLSGLDEKAELKNAGKVTKRGNYTVYTIPAPTQGVDTWGMTSLPSKRRNVFEIPYPIDETCVYSVNLNGVKSAVKNKNVNISNAAGSVTMSIVNNGNSIEIKRHIKLDRSIYGVSEYEAARKLLLEWQSPAFRSIIVR